MGSAGTDPFLDPNAAPAPGDPLAPAVIVPPVPATPAPPTIPSNVGYQAPAPAAPVDPAKQRVAAYQSALDTLYQDKTSPDAAQAAMLRQTPYVDPLKAGLDRAYGVAGIQQSGSVGSTKLSPEAKAAARQSVVEADKQAEATLNTGRVVAANAAAMGQVQSEVAARLEADAAQDLQKLTTIQKRVDDTMQQHQRETDDYLKAQKGVDPNRMMKGGRGVMAALAAGLGAFGSSVNGGPNTALQLIEGAISRDYQAQKDAVDAKRYKSEATGKLVASLRQSLSDEMSVQLAHRAATKEAVATRLEGMVNTFKGTEAEARAAETAQAVRASAQQDLSQLLGRETVHAQTGTSTTIAPIAKPTYANALAEEAAIAKDARSIEDSRGLSPVGQDQDQKVKAIEGARTGLSVLKLLQSAKQELNNQSLGGVNAGITQRGNKFLQDIELALEDYSRVQSGGAKTEDENKSFAKQVMGNLTFTSESVGEMIGRFQNHMADKTRMAVDGLHDKLKDQTWNQIRSMAADDDLYNGLRKGKIESVEDRARQNAVQLRSEGRKRREGPAKQ